MTKSQIFAAMQKDVHSRDALKSKLIALYPNKAAIIRQVFDRYGEN